MKNRVFDGGSLLFVNGPLGRFEPHTKVVMHHMHHVLYAKVVMYHMHHVAVKSTIFPGGLRPPGPPGPALRAARPTS